jgi:hypothetical protein
MRILTVTAALAAALAGTAAQAADFVSCEKFMERLRDAPKVLTFPLPSVQIERNPRVTDSDAFWISYAYPDKEVNEGSLGCSRGHLDDYQMTLYLRDWWPAGKPEASRNVHLIAAALYAYTGWRPQQVITLANKLVAKQPHNVKEDGYREGLPDKGEASISVAEVMVSGKCDPASFPTICGTDKPK